MEENVIPLEDCRSELTVSPNIERVRAALSHPGECSPAREQMLDRDISRPEFWRRVQYAGQPDQMRNTIFTSPIPRLPAQSIDRGVVVHPLAHPTAAGGLRVNVQPTRRVGLGQRLSALAR